MILDDSKFLCLAATNLGLPLEGVVGYRLLHLSLYSELAAVGMSIIRTARGDWDHGLHWSIPNLHILAVIFSMDILYLEGKSPLLMRNNQVKFGYCQRLAKAVHSGIWV